MTSTLMVLGAWFATSAVLCLLLGAVVRRGDEGLDAPATSPVQVALTAAAATAPVPVVSPVATTRPVPVVTGGRSG